MESLAVVGPRPSPPGPLHLRVVRTLERYRRPLPLDFLAHLLRQNRSETKALVDSLVKADLVTLDGREVRLRRSY